MGLPPSVTADYSLARPGETCTASLWHAGNVTVRLQPGEYAGTLWNAATGEKKALPSLSVSTPSWTSPTAPGSNDWALLLQKKQGGQQLKPN